MEPREIEQEEPALVLLAANEAAPAAPPVESVGVDAAIGQVRSLVPAGADVGAGTLIAGAALLAVTGAAIKLGPQALKARAEAAERQHEIEVERLRLEREKAERQDDQHRSCAAERAALEAKVSALESRVSDVADKAQSGGGNGASLGNFDPEDLEERIAKLEKLLKAAAKAKPKGRK